MDHSSDMKYTKEDVSKTSYDNQSDFGGPVQSPPPYASQPVPVMMQPTPFTAAPAQNFTSTTNVFVSSAPVALSTPRAWSSEICHCCQDLGVCCFGMFCSTCQACQLATDMGESCCVPLCVPAALITLRTKLRSHYNIGGSVLSDCVEITCCGPCVQCQMAREIKYLRNTGQLARMHMGV